jgi:hypothetical protein
MLPSLNGPSQAAAKPRRVLQDACPSASTALPVQAEGLLDAMRSLTFDEFEKFGAKVLQELGATKTHVTPHGNDRFLSQECN